MRRSVVRMAVVFALVACSLQSAYAADRDGDGISDQHETVLGTDPDQGDTLQVVINDGLESDENRAKSSYDATKDVLTVEYGHVAEDRHLWRWTVAEPPRPEDTVFHLYIDADADEATGRKVSPGAPNHGTEYMVTVAGGSPRITSYDGEGNSTTGPPLTYVVEGNQVLVLADVPLARDDDGIKFDLYMLCHTASGSEDRPTMSDSSRKIAIRGMPFRAGKKILRPKDHQSNHLVDATFGTETLQRVMADEKNLVVPYNALELDGYEIDPFATRKWPYVMMKQSGAIVRTTAPKAGRYHIGFVMYDDMRDERVVLSVDDEIRGVAVARLGTRRTWLYWLQDAIDFSGDETVELKAMGSGGKHGIAYVVFLAEPPEPRSLPLEVRHLTTKAEPGHIGRVTVSWTTSWPCPTHLKWIKLGEESQEIKHGPPCLAHRVVLEGLHVGAEYMAQAIGEGPDGEVFRGEPFELSAAHRASVVFKPLTIPFTVSNPHPFAAEAWPVTGGVPIPQGRLVGATDVALTSGGRAVPAQVRVAARWPDGSVKWLLVSFAAQVPAESTAEYILEHDGNRQRSGPTVPLAVAEPDGGVRIDTGARQFTIDSSGNLVESGLCQTVAQDTNGTVYQTAGTEAEITVEEPGPIRAVIKTVAPLLDADGNRLFRIEKRIEAYRGSTFLRVHHTLVVDNPEKFTTIRKLNYQVPVGPQIKAWQAALTGDGQLDVAPSQRVFQQTEDRLIVSPGDDDVKEARLVGSLIPQRDGGCTVAVRDAWQNYPKGFSFDDQGLNIELCPPFEKGYYDQFPFEKEGHHRYYSLLDGGYKLKQGVSKTHELLLCFESGEKREQICRLFQEPLILTVPPKWICDSKVFYSIAPRDAEAFPLYEEAIDKNLDRYVERREQQHDFGMLNYGDWYGERGTNWGNVEYDTQYAFFLEYIRSGDPRAFYLGCQTELHNRDIDTVHWNADPDTIGGVYVHQMCHVGEYYDKPVPGSLGFPRGGFTVSHAWTEGHFAHYFLAGDRRSLETGRAVADYFIRKELGRPYDFSSTRTSGWHLIMLCSAYHSTGDPYYLNAARVITERVLELQDKLPRPLPEHQLGDRKPYQEGGWVRAMVPGHCNCDVRHQGNAGFMIAVLLSGLKYYHDITGDERVKESIIRGAHYLLDETYSDEIHGFRYTSCPKHGYRAGTTPLMAEGIARAYLWTKDDRFRRVLTEALPRGAGGSSYGKGFSMYYRMAPRVLADLKAAGIELK
jgi:exo-rhamnogalacturonan lyase-like protein